MPDVNGLYPTPRRKRFVQSVADRDVYSQTEGGIRQSYYADGGKCTFLADECEQADWIEVGPPIAGAPWCRWWQVKDAVRTALGMDKDSIEEGRE